MVAAHTAKKIAELNDALNRAREEIRELKRELAYYREAGKKVEKEKNSHGNTSKTVI